MEIFQGKPQDLEKRLEKEQKTYAFLESVGVEFTRADHPAADTMELCEDIDRALNVKICKNLFLCNRQKTVFYLLLMPGDKPFKTKDLSHQLNVARLSFGEPEDMLRLLNLTPGSVSVMGLIYDPDQHVQLLIDEDVLQEEYFGCHPCINTSSIRLLTKDLTEKILPGLNRTFIKVQL